MQGECTMCEANTGMRNHPLTFFAGDASGPRSVCPVCGAGASRMGEARPGTAGAPYLIMCIIDDLPWLRRKE